MDCHSHAHPLILLIPFPHLLAYSLYGCSLSIARSLLACLLAYSLLVAELYVVLLYADHASLPGHDCPFHAFFGHYCCRSTIIIYLAAQYCVGIPADAAEPEGRRRPLCLSPLFWAPAHPQTDNSNALTFFAHLSTALFMQRRPGKGKGARNPCPAYSLLAYSRHFAGFLFLACSFPACPLYAHALVAPYPLRLLIPC